MTEIFLNLINISITAAYLVVAVIILRLLFRKIPKYIRCILWGIVGIRLLLLFSIESIFSLIPSKEVVPPEIVYQTQPQIHVGIETIDRVMNLVITETFAPEIGASVNPLQIVAGIASNIWIFGMIVLCGYTIVTYFLLKRKVCDAVRWQGNVYQSEKVNSPFVLGIIKPRIYIPYNLSKTEFACVVAHERAHIKRLDYLIKPLAFLLLTVYWFNPLLWIAYILLCKDIELACDEKVIAKMDTDAKKEYSETLINLSIPHHMIMASPVAFGETNVKERIKNIVYYKKPAFWMILLSILVVIIVAVCFLTNPKTKTGEETSLSSTSTETEPPSTDTESVPGTDSNVGTVPAKPEKDDSQVTDETAVGAAYLSHIEDTVYQDLITEMLDTGEFPASGGTQVQGNAYDNSYSVLDVDDDGKEELLINFGNAFAMAGMVCYIYDYDRVTGEVYIEHAGFPDMTFYDNGYLKEEASHNHGRSSLDDFWPYHLYVYNAETDKYESGAFMDAWQQRISEDVDPDPDFPVEKDLDGDGVVYYDMAEDYYEPTMIMDNSEYMEWCEQYNKANTKEIHWYPIITEEEYNERYPSQAVG